MDGQDEVFEIAFDNTHYCNTCKFLEKCPRAKAIYEALLKIEAEAMENWAINLNITYFIDACNRYLVDVQKVMEAAADNGDYYEE